MILINGKMVLDPDSVIGLERVLEDSGLYDDALIGGDKSATGQGAEATDIQIDRTPADLSDLSENQNPDWTFPGTYDLGTNITLDVTFPDEAAMDAYEGYYNINATGWSPIVSGGPNPDWSYDTSYDVCTELFLNVMLADQTYISPDYIGWSNIDQEASGWDPLFDVGDWPIQKTVLFDGHLLTDEPVFLAKGDDCVAIGQRNYIYPNQDGPTGPEEYPHPDAAYWEWPASWNMVAGYQNWTAGQGTTVLGNNNIVERYWSCAVGDHNHLYDYSSRAFGAWNILKGGDTLGIGFRNNTYGWGNQSFGYRNELSGWNNFVFGSGCTTHEADGVGIYEEQDALHNQFNHLFGSELDVNGDRNIIVGGLNTIVGSDNFVAGVGHSVSGDNTVGMGSHNNLSADDCIAIGFSNTITASGAFVIGSGITNDIEDSAEYGPNDNNKIAIRSDGRFIFPGINTLTAPTSGNLPEGHMSYWYEPALNPPSDKPALWLYANQGGYIFKAKIGDGFVDVPAV